MIAIVGGGIIGASLAYFLARQGKQVALFEARDRLGGNCAWTPLGDSSVDMFYHVLTGGNNPLRDLVSDVGLADNLYPVTVTQGFFQDGKIYPASGAKDYLTFGAFGMMERLRMGYMVLNALLTRDWRALDHQRAVDWLIRIGGKRLYERFWKPIMTCKFGPALERVAATDMWFRIHRLGEVAFLRTNNTEGGACYLRGTLRTLFDTMEEELHKLGAQVHKNTAVTQLLCNNGNVEALALADGQTMEVDRVVCAAPTTALAAMLPGSMVQYRASLERIEYLSNICLILKTSKPISQYYQLNLGNADIPFTGVIGAHCFYPPEQYGGYVTYLPRYFYETEELFDRSEESLLAEYMPHLQHICPDFQEDWIQDVTLVHGRNADVLHTLGFADIIPPVDTPLENLNLLTMAQVYPEPTILEHGVQRAREMAHQISLEEID